eukprot:COSAG06_NODE_3455_length_5319_cov_12.049425_3_plen_79_part_00
MPARASRSGHEALAMEVLHSSQTGSWGMLRSKNWCSGAHDCNEGRDVWQHLRTHAQRQWHTVLEQPEIRRSGRPDRAS